MTEARYDDTGAAGRAAVLEAERLLHERHLTDPSYRAGRPTEDELRELAELDALEQEWAERVAAAGEAVAAAKRVPVGHESGMVDVLGSFRPGRRLADPTVARANLESAKAEWAKLTDEHSQALGEINDRRLALQRKREQRAATTRRAA